MVNISFYNCKVNAKNALAFSREMKRQRQEEENVNMNFIVFLWKQSHLVSGCVRTSNIDVKRLFLMRKDSRHIHVKRISDCLYLNN